MKLGSILGLLLATAATGAGAAPGPLWERFPHLVCRLEDQVACYKGSCDTKPMQGLWDVNFTKYLVTYLGSDDTEAIVGRNRTGPDTEVSMDAFLLSSSRMMVFLNAADDPGRELEAQVVGAFGPYTRTIHLTCAVPK